MLEHAAVLNPLDVELQFKHANALIDEVEHHSVQPNRSSGEGQNDHIRMLRERAVGAVRKLATRAEGRYSSSLQTTLGQLQHNLERQSEAQIAYSRALMLLLGPKLMLSRDASAWATVLKKGYLTSLPTSELPALAGDERYLALQILHGLDCVLQRQSRKERRKLPRVHAAGIALDLWPHAHHRPRDITGGRLLSCAVHRRDHYGPLVAALEAATDGMREELFALLRRVAEGDEEETRHWYTNQEGIARQPAEWVQRHVSCTRAHDDDDGRATFLPTSTQAICAAVHGAMGWYYGSGAAEGMPAPMDKYFGVAMLSVLGPGSHVTAHTGPVNERVVFSLGLAGNLEESEIRVGTARRRWQRGKAIVFDDSLEHEVKVKNGTQPRAVLIMHVKHPQLMPPNTNGRRLAGHHLKEAVVEEDACEEGNFGHVDWEEAKGLPRAGQG